MKLPIITALSVGLLCAQVSFATPTQTPTPTTPTAQTKTPTQQSAQPTTGSLTTQKDKVSYSIGIDLGENFKSQGIDIDPTVLVRGLQDALANHTPAITKQEMANTLITFQKELVTKRETQVKTESSKNLQEGNAYLAANQKKPGVITLPDGLQYKIINPGKGESPALNDVVTVNYKGTFVNGKVFDSSYDRKQAVTFPVSEVILGWQEVLKLMKPGATYEVVVPANLAYGERGMGNAIGPNQTLVFTINLVAIKKAS